MLTGSIKQDSPCRVIRDGKVIADLSSIQSIRHFKETVTEASKGQECGIQMEEYQDFVPGDILESYSSKIIPRKL